MGIKSVAHITFIVIIFSSYAFCQFEPTKNYLYNSYTGLNSDANLFNDISLNSFELLSTNVQFSKDDDLQKVVFVPFRLLSLDNLKGDNYNFLYNTKLNFAQKNGVSTIGIGFTYDNSLPGTKRGNRIFNQTKSKASIIKKQINEKFKKVLESDIQKSKNQTLQYILSNSMINYIESQIKRIENDVVSFSFIKPERSNFLEKHGFTYEDFLYYKSKVESYNKSTKSKFDKELTNEYYKDLMTNSIKITFGGNLSFFSILSSDDLDLDNDNLNDNEFNLKQNNLSLGFTHIVNEVWGYSLTGYYLKTRAAAEESNDLESYIGFSSAISFRTWILDKTYKSSKDYLESLFVPSVHTGIALEYLKCNAEENSDCSDGITQSFSLTPFIEFKINPKNQFRLGVPVSRNSRINSEKAEVGPFIQWRLQLSGKS